MADVSGPIESLGIALAPYHLPQDADKMAGRLPTWAPGSAFSMPGNMAMAAIRNCPRPKNSCRCPTAARSISPPSWRR